MDDITRQCARLSLHTKERQTIPLTFVFETNNRALVAKLFTKRRVNVEAQNIISQGPWSFDKYLIGLYQLGTSKSVDDAKFDTSSFWIQIHNLPFSLMTRVNATAIGSTISIVEQVEASPSGECRGCYIRVRISINIEQPLCWGQYVDLGDSDPHWISFQYECLPIFCYWCGRLNRDERDYKLWTDSGESLQKNDQQYRPWFRASLTAI